MASFVSFGHNATARSISMNLEQALYMYMALGITIWLMVVLREYPRLVPSEIVTMLTLTIIFWPAIIIAALLRVVVFRHYDQDQD